MDSTVRQIHIPSTESDRGGIGARGGSAETTRAGKSLVAFGIYLLMDGVILLISPEFVGYLFRLAPTEGLWARIAAMLLLILGYLCVRSGLENQTQFLRWSVHTRSSVLLFMTAFVLFQRVSPWVMLFGIMDFSCAMWTVFALRADARDARATMATRG